MAWTIVSRRLSGITLVLLLFLVAGSLPALAQPETSASVKLDPQQITIGDRARLFLEATNKTSGGRLIWPAIADTFNHLEVVERGKIDTVKAGDIVTYKQRLLITGFDSGVFQMPAVPFYVIAENGDSFFVEAQAPELLVQTVPVDTTKAFKPIKNIIYVTTTWRDYAGYIAGGVALLALIIGVTWYLARRKKPAPVVPEGPKETLQEHALRLLSELDARQMWQNERVKEYYVDLTDIVRNYVEERFDTPVMELTTDELLDKARRHKELIPYYATLESVLRTADLAKFAKAQPLPQEHIDAMEKAKQLIISSKPIVTEQPPTTEQKS